MKKLEDRPGGRLRFDVRLSPRASRSAVSGWTADGSLKISVTAPPVDEAANEELIACIARELRIRKAAVLITRGRHSRKKQMEVPGECKNRLLSFADI
ncbi:MAG: DUF167 domain-containing protein [Chitinivibrionia bacterium]|nr:DUF167 domain-containing protein [Chitinivibrionia bacterium]